MIREIEDAGIEEDEGLGGEVWDDRTGDGLPGDLVKGARKEELDYMHTRKIWDVRPVAECWDKNRESTRLC